MKKWMLSITALLMAIMLSGCPNPRVAEYCATSQKGTTWQSEDGRITFYVDEDVQGQAVCPVFGTVETEDGPVEIAIFMTYLDNGVEITPADDPAAHDPTIGHYPLEFWRYTKVQEKTFQIEVIDGYYLETGEIIKFHRVDP